MRNILVDTGAIVGLLERTDRHHERSREFFESLRATDKLVTTWPVITECSFILRRQEGKFWNWLLDGEVQIVDFDIVDIPRMRAWREKYEDREVDFADAALVWLADARRTNLVATTEFADFETYRLYNGKTFKLMIRKP